MSEKTEAVLPSSRGASWWRAWTLGATTWRDWLLWGLAVLFLLGRFARLEQSPPGFFSDEFRGALHQICLGERAESADGAKWPGFVVGGGGGLYTPPFLYLGALWLKVWGPSIAASRAFVATFGALSVVGITALSRRLGGNGLARMVFLAAALSPWGFQFSRIAWDPPMACACLVLAVLFWTLRHKPLGLVASAVFLSGAVYCYPPTRIQAPLVFLPLVGWALFNRTLSLRQAAAFGAVCVALCWKLITGTLSGELNGRGSVEAIWAPGFVAHNHGRYSKAWFIAQTFLDNFQAHFRPSYLFFSGDANLRHSTQWLGELGYVDILALGFVGVRAVMWVFAALRGSPVVTPPAATKRELTVRRAVAFSAAAFLIGVVPAALCWSGVPHALRSIGCWPFLAIMTGYVLDRARRSGRAAEIAILCVASLYTVVFAHAYFVKYPKLSGSWYDEEVKRAMIEPGFDADRRRALIQTYPEAFRFYAIVENGETCASSQKALDEYWSGRPGRKRKRR